MPNGDSRGRPIFFDVSALTEPDIDTIDALARLQIEAWRRGRSLCFQGASQEVRELIALAGLSHILPCRDALLVGAEWQSEERKEPSGVQEEGDPADPSV